MDGNVHGDHCGEGDVHLFRRLRAFSGVDSTQDQSRFKALGLRLHDAHRC
jgi:hypothetical protein